MAPSEAPRQWRFLDELEGAEEARRAYPELARAALVDRRMAMRLMAASAALAAATGCGGGTRRTLTAEPGERTSGEIIELPTTLDQNGLGFGVIVRTVGGRPIKIEGDPGHPASLGRSNPQAQAALLDHYDPERLRIPRIGGERADWDRALRLIEGIREHAREVRGCGLHVLVRPTASPTFERLLRRIRVELPAARIYGHRPLPLEPVRAPGLADADYILSIGQDFLGPGPMQVRLAADYMAARRAGLEAGTLPRLVVAESVPTLTGTQADERIAMSPQRMERFAATLTGQGDDPDGRRIAGEMARASAPLVLVGDRAPQAVRDRGIAASGENAPLFQVEGLGDVATLARSLEQGLVDQLVIVGGNPAYDAPAGLDFGALAGRAERSLYLGDRTNETAVAATDTLPLRSQLARWGDLRAFNGEVSLVRPVARGTGLSEIEVLGLLAGEGHDGEALVRATREGTAEPAPAPPAPAACPVPRTPPPEPKHGTAGGDFVLIFQPDAKLWDGSLADNAWLQELPDPVTGLAWGNAATMAPATADRLGLEDGDEIEIGFDGREIRAPAKRLPGQAPGTVGLSLGQGRRGGGIGEGVGVDAFALWDGRWIVEGASVRRTGAHRRLIETNRFFRTGEADAVRWTQPGAPPVRADAADTPAFVDPDREATKQWGMVIDLETCIGCNACTIACQAENNIPAVGPEETANGRAMHWIRVDRYHEGDSDEPVTAFQPVPCMHCETAPCEPVCPVGATTHSSEGLNQMTYQRCIGTRSCSNNCPYKVRRFNWFEYQDDEFAMPEEGFNPRVTIRDRGVMEKCTYCVQRIEAVRTGERDGPPVTACQQACPTRAIVFGDLADVESEVAEARRSPRNYALLGGLNLEPRTTYLARLRRNNG